MSRLDERKEKILLAVIENFVLNAEPVGSKRLVESYSLEVSPATVRNDLALLEELGYLNQPHTSSGRVPTDLGYRYYVDHISNSSELALSESRQIRAFFTQVDHEIELMMRKTSSLLAGLTNSLAVVYAPDVSKEQIKHIDLVGLADNLVMVVVITSKGSLLKQVIETTEKHQPEFLMSLEHFLNVELKDTYAEGLRRKRLDTTRFTEEGRLLLDEVQSQIVRGLSAISEDRVYFDGAAYLLGGAEGLVQAQEVLNLIEQNYRLLEWLQAVSEECDLIVSIGSENRFNLDSFSLVASSYEVDGESLGALGVLGPTRMDYGRTISAVKDIAKNLGATLGDFHN